MEAIVIGNDHYNTLNVLRSLGRSKIKFRLIIVSPKTRSFISKSKYVSDYEITEKLSIDKLIENYAKGWMRIPLIPTTDSVAAFLDEHYDRLSEFFILPSVGFKQGMLKREMSKDIQLRHAVEAGFNVPKSMAVDLQKDYSQSLAEISYPCLIKPEESIGGSKDDFRICRTERELTSSLNELSKNLKKVLIQQYIPNDEVILVGGVRSVTGEDYIYGEINKTKHSNEPHNLGLNCFGVLRESTQLKSLCQKYIDLIDYHGCFSIECLRPNSDIRLSENPYYFIEINLRTDGLYYFYSRGGIDYASIWVMSCYGETPRVLPVEKKIYGMNEFTYVKNALSAQSLKDLFKSDVFSTFDWKDMKPFIYRFIYHG